MSEKALCVIFFVIGLSAGIFVGTLVSDAIISKREADKIHKAAVEAGAGEYYLDEKYEKQFRFIRSKDKVLK